MEEMSNRPCLDMEKAIKVIREQFCDFGISEEMVRETLKSCFIGWFSRSIASALFAYCKDEEGDWCVLASERGAEAADFRGRWNCPCGYLDFNERVDECAQRECFEETGVQIPLSEIHFIGYEDDPIKANRQNVTFRFGAFLEGAVTSDFKFSKEGNEGEEVGDIKWIKVKDIDNYEWAFNHDTRIKEIFDKRCGYNSRS